MKKLMILPFIALLAIGTSSCKKNGDCVCTVSGITVSTTTNVTRATCDRLDDAAKIGGGSCKLK